MLSLLFTETAPDNAPGKINSPAFNSILNSCSLLASQAIACAGCPNAAAPAPVAIKLLFYKVSFQLYVNLLYRC